ncbi:MAG: hypothetical protein GVY21_07420 [Gammaproteobacteria bacterium]|jgi:hypothetical protein|nr:hypothetical protein [Gammaproteobacteria bacterium]
MASGTESGRPAKKEGRIARQVRIAKEVRAEPRTALTLIRSWLVGLWTARGGGLYGLGVVVSFLILEARMIAGDLAESSGVADFLVGEFLEFVFRLGFMSVVNGFLALLWPLWVLERLGFWGIVLLAGAYAAFEYGLRPLVESRVPELAQAREAKAARRREKREKKTERARRRAAKKARRRGH